MQKDRPIESVMPGRIEHFGKDSPPETLLIACTDPVLDARLLDRFRTEPLLLWRSTGPVIPPYGSRHFDLGAEEIIDHALVKLGIREIALCGHLPSDLLQTLTATDSSQQSSHVEPHRYYAQSTRRIVLKKYGQLQPDELCRAVAKENVLVQMANLRTYPTVLAGLACGSLRLHSWIYDTEVDTLHSYGTAQSPLLNRVKLFAQPLRTPLSYLDPCDIYLA